MTGGGRNGGEGGVEMERGLREIFDASLEKERSGHAGLENFDTGLMTLCLISN